MASWLSRRAEPQSAPLPLPMDLGSTEECDGPSEPTVPLRWAEAAQGQTLDGAFLLSLPADEFRRTALARTGELGWIRVAGSS